MHDRFLDHPVPTDAAPTASGPSLWEIVWQRKAYVALGAVVGLALGVLYWSMTPKVYESSAQVWVLKKQPNAPLSSTEGASLAGDTNPAEDFLSTHQTVLRSAVILSNAVAKGHLRDLETFRSSKRPARDLFRALTVGRDRDKSASASATSQVLNISFRCNHAEDCGPVLTAVLDSYRDFLNDDSHNSAKKTLKLINDARELLENKLEAKQKAYDEFRHKSPFLWKSQYGTTLHQDRLAGIDAQRAVLVVRMARIRATLEAVDAAVKEGRDRAELLDIVSALPGQSPMMGGGRMQRGLSGHGQRREGGKRPVEQSRTRIDPAATRGREIAGGFRSIASARPISPRSQANHPRLAGSLYHAARTNGRAARPRGTSQGKSRRIEDRPTQTGACGSQARP